MPVKRHVLKKCNVCLLPRYLRTSFLLHFKPKGRIITTMVKNTLTFMALICGLSTSVLAGFDMISTKDGTCQFFYPTDKNTQGWYIEPSSEAMCQNGVINKHGQITIYNAFGKPIEQIYGFFTGGYWTGKKELSANIISGYDENAMTYKVSFELPSDTGFDVRYLSQMISKKQKDGSFSPFSFCEPFRILIQTRDYGLFQDKSLTTEIIDDVARYAKTLCPAEQKIQLFGSSEERPSQDDVFFYADIDLKTAQIDVKRNEAHLFAKRQENIADTVENIVNLQQTVDSQTQVSPVERVSESLLSDSVPVVQSQVGNEVKEEVAMVQLMDKVPHLLTLSRLTGQPVQGTVVVDIKRVMGKTAEVIAPYHLQLTGDNLINGWAIVSGDFSHVSGRKGAELTGKVQVSSVLSCSEPNCTDIK